MAANLVLAGFDVTVYDRDAARVASLVERGPRVADGLAGVAAADIVLISVPGRPSSPRLGPSCSPAWQRGR
jgi:3-hydroxyisobutyrate dehydrogenase-like beta-hydroxyacid dehydrogenase